MAKTRIPLRWDDIDLGALVLLRLEDEHGETSTLSGYYAGLRHTVGARGAGVYVALERSDGTEVWELKQRVRLVCLLHPGRRQVDGDDCDR